MFAPIQSRVLITRCCQFPHERNTL